MIAVQLLRFSAHDDVYLHTGEKVVLFHQEGVKVLLQLQGAAEVDHQLQNDIEDIEVGVPHCLLLINLPVQALGQ